jgi:hypothetical protein
MLARVVLRSARRVLTSAVRRTQRSVAGWGGPLVSATGATGAAARDRVNGDVAGATREANNVHACFLPY